MSWKEEQRGGAWPGTARHNLCTSRGVWEDKAHPSQGRALGGARRCRPKRKMSFGCKSHEKYIVEKCLEGQGTVIKHSNKEKHSSQEQKEQDKTGGATVKKVCFHSLGRVQSYKLFTGWRSPFWTRRVPLQASQPPPICRAQIFEKWLVLKCLQRIVYLFFFLWSWDVSSLCKSPAKKLSWPTKILCRQEEPSGSGISFWEPAAHRYQRNDSLLCALKTGGVWVFGSYRVLTDSPSLHPGVFSFMVRFSLLSPTSPKNEWGLLRALVLQNGAARSSLLWVDF